MIANQASGCPARARPDRCWFSPAVIVPSILKVILSLFLCAPPDSNIFPATSMQYGRAAVFLRSSRVGIHTGRRCVKRWEALNVSATCRFDYGVLPRSQNDPKLFGRSCQARPARCGLHAASCFIRCRITKIHDRLVPASHRARQGTHADKMLPTFASGSASVYAVKDVGSVLRPEPSPALWLDSTYCRLDLPR